MRLLSARLCLLALLGALAISVHAVPVANLYQATVPVPSTQESDRATAFSDALKKVVARVAGNQGAQAESGLSATFSHAESLVQSYRYVKGPDEQDQIQVSFGAVGVNRALASAGVPVWGANRPLMVVWAAVDTGSGRILVTPDSGDWASAFNKAARAWGLPIVLPRYDAADQRSLNLSEVWGQFMDSISAASHRYHADLVVALRIAGQSGQWSASWQMQGGDVQAQGQNTADTPEDLASAVAQAWAQDLAKRYAVPPAVVGSDQSVDLAIKGVNGLGSYAAVRQALHGMTPIQAVVPVNITPDELILRVKFAGELAVLQQYIALDHRFKSRETPAQAFAPVTLPTSAPETSPAASTSAPEVSSAPVASEQAGAVAGITSGPTVEAVEPEAGSAGFSRLYPRLDYTWTGGAAPASPGKNGSSSAPGKPSGTSGGAAGGSGSPAGSGPQGAD